MSTVAVRFSPCRLRGARRAPGDTSASGEAAGDAQAAPDRAGQMTCHPHRVGLSSSVAIYLEGKLKQAVNILITVTGQTSWPQEEEYAHPRWYITVPDSADRVSDAVD